MIQYSHKVSEPLSPRPRLAPSVGTPEKRARAVYQRYEVPFADVSASGTFLFFRLSALYEQNGAPVLGTPFLYPGGQLERDGFDPDAVWRNDKPPYFTLATGGRDA
jgi:hypothetical protein